MKPQTTRSCASIALFFGALACLTCSAAANDGVFTLQCKFKFTDANEASAYKKIIGKEIDDYTITFDLERLKGYSWYIDSVITIDRVDEDAIYISDSDDAKHLYYEVIDRYTGEYYYKHINKSNGYFSIKQGQCKKVTLKPFPSTLF